MDAETKTRTKVHSGLFSDKESAEAAYNAALRRGYKPEDIHVIMSEETRKKFFGPTIVKIDTGDKSMEGMALGGAFGGTVVGVLGAIVALSTTIVIPGLGLVVAGPLAAGLVGAGAGSIAGAFMGALIGAGFTEERAKVYEKRIKEGDIMMGVNSLSDEEDSELIEDWKKYKGKDIS